jgi:hypothetical protein
MGTGTTGRNIKAVKPARCSICKQIPQADCAWRQGRCPHRQPGPAESAIRSFFNFLTQGDNMALTKPTKTQMPDPRRHKIISFVKSGIRIVAFGFLAYYEIQAAAVLLLVAELVGVAEEMV